LQFLFLY